MNPRSWTLPMVRALSLTAALILVIATGLVHGRWTGRWATSQALDTAVARLERVPLKLGTWQGRDLEMNREQLAMAEIAGYVSRRYENRAGRGAVTILLVCGRPGPISVHTPDICYRGAGFEPTWPPEQFTLAAETAGQAASFRNALFVKSGAAGSTYLRILWSWTSTGSWEAPENPRLQFASRQALYKLYVIRELATVAEPLDSDPGIDFLRVLLPDLERKLFADS